MRSSVAFLIVNRVTVCTMCTSSFEMANVCSHHANNNICVIVDERDKSSVSENMGRFQWYANVKETLGSKCREYYSNTFEHKSELTCSVHTFVFSPVKSISKALMRQSSHEGTQWRTIQCTDSSGSSGLPHRGSGPHLWRGRLTEVSDYDIPTA